MPYRRRYRRKKNFRRRGKRYARRYNPRRYIPTKWGRSKYNIHKYRRYGGTETLPLTAQLAGGEAPAQLTFRLSQVVNVNELTRLYDQFRIDFVSVIMNWSPKEQNQTTFNVGPNSMSYPMLYYYKDYDDSVAPSSLTQMKERGNLKGVRITPFRKVRINLKPAVQNAVIRDPTTNPPTLGTNPIWNKKLDCAVADTPHLGLKFLIDYATGIDLGSVNIETIYHVTMFGTR